MTSGETKPLKILVSAYACAPGRGSEPGVGWSCVTHLANSHKTWVITRSSNRAAIEAELTARPVNNLYVLYHDLPGERWWRRGRLGLEVHYYLWQVTIYRRGRALARKTSFDVAHHVTYARYWTPNALSLLPIPFLYGPVGGAETAPKSFRHGFGLRGRLYEAARDIMRWLAEHDPLLRRTVRRSRLALAATAETAAALRRLGAGHVRIDPAIGLEAHEISMLGRLPPPPEWPFRFVSVCRLLHWKGVHLGLQAFAEASVDRSEYWIVGDGPERRRLEALCHRLGIANRVRFLGHLPRNEALQTLARCHVLVHPSLHDSGGYVCLEAMAAGRPVLCFDIGGPAGQVTEETGRRISASTPEQAARDLGCAMTQLSRNRSVWQAMGVAAHQHVRTGFAWDKKTERTSAFYHEIIQPGHGVRNKASWPLEVGGGG